MSHFCLIVATPARQGVRDALYPFWNDDRDEGPAQPHFVFVEDKHADINPSAGRPGYWRNPVGKWDAWMTGGRWAGLFGGEDQIEATALKGLLRRDPHMLAPVHATLVDGVWREADPRSSNSWPRDVEASLLALPAGLWLTVVDCHC
ncbi:MAG: hypothetical protein ACK4MV_15830 [Beijerinckiaceae bacterium]